MKLIANIARFNQQQVYSNLGANNLSAPISDKGLSMNKQSYANVIQGNQTHLKTDCVTCWL